MKLIYNRAMVDKIKMLKEIREKKKLIEQEEKELTEPLMSDISNITLVYGIFKNQINKIDNPPKERSVAYRQMFIYVVLMIYAPGVLIGDRMPNGLRKHLSDLLGVWDSVISDNSANVVFMYSHYKWFRDSVNYLYADILFRLNYGNIK